LRRNIEIGRWRRRRFVPGSASLLCKRREVLLTRLQRGGVLGGSALPIHTEPNGPNNQTNDAGSDVLCNLQPCSLDNSVTLALLASISARIIVQSAYTSRGCTLAIGAGSRPAHADTTRPAAIVQIIFLRITPPSALPRSSNNRGGSAIGLLHNLNALQHQHHPQLDTKLRGGRALAPPIF
jgi:hypothetical protein